jgi:hypothetical protein
MSLQREVLGSQRQLPAILLVKIETPRRQSHHALSSEFCALQLNSARASSGRGERARRAGAASGRGERGRVERLRLITPF